VPLTADITVIQGVVIGFAAVVALPVFFYVRSALRDARRRRLRRQPFPDAWREIITRTMPLYEKLPAALREQLHGHINVFLAEKRFEGCAGLEITDEIRLTVAAQACLLLLNRKTDYFRKLTSIVVYPHTYVSQNARGPGGMVMGGGTPTLGESWGTGTLVLAWDSVMGGAQNIRDGRNVTMHEFAHQLDQEDGAADGAPILERFTCYASWARVLGAEYAALQRKARKGRRSALRSYGATNPAEFFAVATEAFIEKPKTFKRKHPELYEELQSYYRFDPLEWRRASTAGRS